VQGARKVSRVGQRKGLWQRAAYDATQRAAGNGAPVLKAVHEPSRGRKRQRR